MELFGIEALSRGAKQAYFCDSSFESIKILKENLKKTKFENEAVVMQKDFKKALQELKNLKFDLVFLDPPYQTNYVVEAMQYICESDLLKQEGKIVVETDDEKVLNAIEKIDSAQQIDKRKYGRVTLVFLSRRK